MAERGSGRGRGGRIGFAVLLAGLSAWTVLASSLHRGHTGDVFDDGLYFVSAQALSRGEGYTLPSQVGPPARSRYPVGLPAVVALALKYAPGERLLERDAAVARVVMLVLAWVFFLASYVWLRRVGAPTVWAVPIVLASAFDPTVTMLSIAVMSDVPLAALVMLEAGRWASRRRRSGWTAWNVINGVLAGAALTVRVTGVALLPASVLAARRGGGRWRLLTGSVAVAAGAALVVLPARGFVEAGGGRPSGNYGNEFLAGWMSAEAGARLVVRNLSAMALMLPQVGQSLFFTNAMTARPGLYWSCWAALATLMSVGTVALARSSRRRDLPVWAFVSLTLGAFVVWSGPFTHRFVLSLYPMLMLAVARGADVSARAFGGGRRLGVACGATVLLLALAGDLAFMGQVARRARAQGGLWGDPAVRADFEATLEYIRSALEPDAVVVSMTPETVFLYTSRQGALLLRELDKVRNELGRPDLILGRMDESPGRPFYLMGPRPGSETTAEAAHVEALVLHPALKVEEVYRSPLGALCVARLGGQARTRVPPHDPAPRRSERRKP